MANIVLVMPLANRFDKVSPRIPSGLLAIAAQPVQAGWSVFIVDLKLVDDWKAELEKNIGPETVCVGITCSTGKMILSGLEVAGYVRKTTPKLPIVWGGPHPTLVPHQTLEHPFVDYVIINEGDDSFFELVQCLKVGGDPSAVSGIGYKVDGFPHLTEKRALKRDVSGLSPTPYHLVDVTRYSSLDVDGSQSIDVLTSRGCPFNCGFCSTPKTSERLWRPYPVKRVVDDVEFLYRTYGVRSFYFVDDNFMVDLKRVEEILGDISRRGMKIYWGTQGVRVDTINKMSPEFIDLLEESGCRELSVGVESGNPDILRMIDKRITVEEVLKANDKIKGKKIAVKYNMIIGFPGERMEQVKKTVRLALDLYNDNSDAWFPFNIYTPFPATPMFEEAEKYGFLPPSEFSEWANLESVGWERHYNHWLSHEENELLRSVNFTSYLAFPSAKQKISNPFIKFLFKLYQPIAQFRFSKMFYAFHIERFIVEAIESWRTPSDNGITPESKGTGLNG